MELTRTNTDRLLETALGGLSARQRVSAANVANADTPGFKASRVEFEQALRRAQGESGELAMFSVANAVTPPADDSAALEPTVVQDARTTRRLDGNNVDIDREMVELAETNITYNALAQLTSSRFQLLRTVINDGRR
jgi:flagellar basal-body rod protein FlgB